MKPVRAGLWIAIFSTAAVALIGVVDMGRTSPGPLTSVHQREEGLDDSSSCSECHGGWFSSMTESCSECHERISEQIAARAGLHGTLEEPKASQCALCHSEHHGAGFAIVNARSFALAGVPDVLAFEHRTVGFEMTGAHLELACNECHEHASDAVLPQGALRYGGLKKDCTSCHEDPHKSQFAVACTACHGQDKWDRLFSVGHEAQLPLVGGHASVNCRSCHAEAEAHALELVGGRGEKPAARACAACHTSPHEPAFDSGVAQMVLLERDAACVVCHESEHTDFAQASVVTTVEQHALSGFRLDLPHHEVTCEQCHAPELERYAQRFPGRSPDTCSACHDDPHAGQFATGPFSSGDCIVCHAREHFEPHTFDAEEHARAALVLDGRHAEIECSECHVDPAPGQPRAFRGTDSACDACHTDAHDGFFAPVAKQLEPVAHGDCARCHDTREFAAAATGRFDHARWTHFAILGAHAQSDCAACHPLAQEPDEHGRTFGRVSEHFGRFTGCATCHPDPHEGRFDRDGMPATVEARAGCARCHVETSFRSFPKGFDHGRWTGFTLVAEHRSAACSACHAPLRGSDAAGRTWAPAAGTGCADCHEDPHAGQFDVRKEPADCQRCHSEGRRDFLKFDHDRDSRFPLSEPHARLECSACHHEVSARGLEFVRYRPLGTECFDCHGVQEDVLMRRRTRGK